MRGLGVMKGWWGHEGSGGVTRIREGHEVLEVS